MGLWEGRFCMDFTDFSRFVCQSVDLIALCRLVGFWCTSYVRQVHFGEHVQPRCISAGLCVRVWI